MNCEPNALAAAAKCYCLPPGKVRQVWTYLLTQWAVGLVPVYPYDALAPARTTNSIISSFTFLAISFYAPSFRSILRGLRLKLSKTNANPGTLTAALWASNVPISPALPVPTVLITTLGTIDDAVLSVTPTYNDHDVVLSANPILQPNTRYWVRLSDTGTARLGVTTNSTDPAVTGEFIRVTPPGLTFRNSVVGASMFRVQVEQLC